MVIGQIGLGEKAYSLAQELIRNKFTVVAYDPSPAHRRKAADNGIVTTSSVQAVLLHLPTLRIVNCVMDSEDEAQQVLHQLLPLLEPNDILVNIGFSNHNSQLYNTKNLLEVKLVDDAIEIKGNPSAYDICKPIFETIAKGKNIHFSHIEP